MATRRRGGRAVGLLVIATATLTGCAPPMIACPAIGYGSTAHITLENPRADVTLELCDGEGCVPGGIESPVQIGETPPSATGITALTGDSVDGWTAEMINGQTVMGYRLTDTAGSVIAEGELDVEWVRIDGDDRCGGNRAADVVLPA